MIEHYAALKLVHILSSTLLFGTGLGTAFYMWRADKSRNIEVIALVAKNVVLADYLFTLPAVIIQPVTGYMMLVALGAPFSTPWVAISIGLFVFVGCCWIPVVFIQQKVARIAAKASHESSELPLQYHRLMRFWYALGWPAFLSVLAIFYLMVNK